MPQYSSTPPETPDPTRAWHARTVTYYPRARDTTSQRQVPLLAALEAIGDGTYAHRITQLRTVRHTQGVEAYSALKPALPGYTFGGTFTRRGIAHLLAHSGIVHGDLDHLPDLEAVFRAYVSDPHVAYAFTSPGGDGLKLGVLVAPVTTPAAYTHAWRAVATHYSTRYGVPWDASGKDISRLCFVSHDPALYIQDRPTVFPVPPAPEPQPPPRPPMPQGALNGERPGDALKASVRWADILTPAGWRLERQQGEQAYWTRPGKTRGVSATSGGGGEQVLYVFSSNAPPFDPDTSYTKFRAYSLLQHGGDDATAAQHLAAQFHLPRPPARPRRPEDTPDFVDPWLGPRSEWHGIAVASIQRSISHE